MKTRHQLYEFMRQAASEMAAEYRRISSRASEDPGTAGDEGEESWAALLRNWLPATYPVVTKGRILFSDDTASPQIDILVLSPNYPQKLRNKKLYFAGGVIAALECKLTLRKSHIPKIISTAKVIKEKEDYAPKNTYEEMNSRIVYGVLAHSHGWSQTKQIADQVTEIMQCLAGEGKYLDFDLARLYPDFYCISDTATFCYNKRLVWREAANESELETLDEMEADAKMALSYDAFWSDDEESWMFGIVQGTLLEFLFHKMAYFDHSIRSLADYIKKTEIAPISVGMAIVAPVHVEEWVKENFEMEGGDDNPWNPWGPQL